MLYRCSHTATRRYTFPIPIPASHTFFLSELDYKDGFIHMSTSKQVPKTLERFFADVPSVTLLRADYARLSSFKRIIWEGEHDSEYHPQQTDRLQVKQDVADRVIANQGEQNFPTYTHTLKEKTSTRSRSFTRRAKIGVLCWSSQRSRLGWSETSQQGR